MTNCDSLDQLATAIYSDATLSVTSVYDLAGRRVSRNGDTFTYNGRSEVAFAAIGTNAYGYAFDGIGNRTFSSVNSINTVYTANNLNQYTAVNAVTPQYDADGNLTAYGGWTYAYNAENRMTAASYDSVLVASYAYDYLNRCVRETTEAVTRRFVWDGWNIAATVDVENATQNSSVTYYVWGPDVSGSLQGAGGVGGLLAVKIGGQIYIPFYDNNGNISEYVDTLGNIRAHYEYSPFGETVAQTGDLADTFPHRFSTKYYDAETRSYYYGYRHYAPMLGCWFSMDPAGEVGGINQYGFVNNNPITTIP